MSPENTPEQANEFLRRVIPMLSQHGLPPTPTNYSVLYSYLVGSSQSLNENIDGFLASKKKLSATTMNKLHEKYIRGNEQLQQQAKIQQALEKFVSEAGIEIQQVTDNASSYSDSLSQHNESLSLSGDPQSASMVLKQVMQDTRDMIRSNKEMQVRMQETNSEISKIKSELEAVKAGAEKDALTGLKNRGTFDKTIHSIVRSENKVNATLIILDIDHFKRINDNFGHLVGDRVIRYLSALLTQVIGSDHHIARYGGEEFAVIIKNKPLEVAQKLADKVRIAMGNSKLQRKDSGESIGKVTISAGIATLKPNDTVDDFIDRADKALYQAKETGRDKVIFSG